MQATDHDPNKEEEVVDEADDQDEPPTFRYEITSYGADYPIDALVKRISSQDIIVPTFGPETRLDEIRGFQRSLVWSKTQSDRFIESLLLGLPVPGIFLVAQGDGVFLSWTVSNACEPFSRSMKAYMEEGCMHLRKCNRNSMERHTKRLPQRLEENSTTALFTQQSFDRTSHLMIRAAYTWYSNASTLEGPRCGHRRYGSRYTVVHSWTFSASKTSSALGGRYTVKSLSA